MNTKSFLDIRNGMVVKVTVESVPDTNVARAVISVPSVDELDAFYQPVFFNGEDKQSIPADEYLLRMEQRRLTLQLRIVEQQLGALHAFNESQKFIKANKSTKS